MLASTCTETTNFDTRLAVFSGESCESLSCIEANSDSPTMCSNNNNASIVQWKTQINRTYYLHVFGAPGQSGNFGLLIEEVPAPLNDACVDSIFWDHQETFQMDGSITGASPDVFAPRCRNDATRSPGVWYQMNGTGGDMELSNCETPSYRYGAIVPGAIVSANVYTGACDQLECGAGNSALRSCDGGIFDGNASWTLSWFSERDETYYLLIQASIVYGGNFRLSLLKVDPPQNDACTTAEMLTLSGGKASTSGSSYGAYVDEDVPWCDRASASSISSVRGIWYQVKDFNVTSGSYVVASTCSQLTDYLAYLSIYSGECGSLKCVVTYYNYDLNCGEASTVQWRPHVNETYYILVHGSTVAMSGRFSLTVQELVEH